MQNKEDTMPYSYNRQLPAAGSFLRMLPAAIIFFVIAGCQGLPPLDRRTPSLAFHDTADTRLGRAVASLEQAHPQDSAVHPLNDGLEAFAARMHLADAAERSIDAQYYIWHKDISGTLLIQALRRAAERGVRVRLLIDDNNTSDLEATLASLQSDPNIQVRIFNPFTLRKLRLLNYLSDFSRLNHRMHNKAFIVDNQAAVIGGRNIGDEYFGVTEGIEFVDADVLTIGPIVDDISASFDAYWASDSAYPANRVLPEVPRAAMADMENAEAEMLCSTAAADYAQALAGLAPMAGLADAGLELDWGKVWLLSDVPAKALGLVRQEELVAERLRQDLGMPAHSMDLISPYFVPSPEFAEALMQMARDGVRIRIVTNSLEASDVAAVHAGYAKWRIPFLRSGIRIYETKHRAVPNPETKGEGGHGSVLHSSGRALHAKIIAVDEARVFVGSFNVDQRSRRLNTEMGIVTESPLLLRKLEDAFDTAIPKNSYRLQLTESGRLQWMEQDQSGVLATHDAEPGVGLFKRLGVELLSILPVDWLL
jgi:putative cardiolipin synthase